MGNKITANETIALLLAFKNNGQDKNFYEAAERYVNTMTAGGRVYMNLSYHLREGLKKTETQFIELRPISANLGKFATQRPCNVDNMFLNEETRSLIGNLICEWKNAELFSEHNLNVRNKMLLYGETGNGKTTFAKYIASQAGLPFIVINSEAVIDSHLGSTGRNINTVFKEIDRPCVLFWDEIDSIATSRGNGKTDMNQETNRIVNAFLVNIETLRNDVVFIGATNMFNNLDPALKRRFDIKHEMKPPIQGEKIRYANNLGLYYKIPLDYLPKMEQFDPLVSYAEIESLFKSAARAVVMSKIQNKEKEPALQHG